MSKKFMKLVIEFLDLFYNNPGPSVKTPQTDEIIANEKFKNVIYYLAIRKFIKITYKNEENNDASPENIKHVHLTDSGMGFLNNYKDRESQKDSNKIIAFTAAILALIGIYTFVKDIGLINETNTWIKYIFLAFVIVAIGPIVTFIIKSYFLRD